MVFDDTTGSHDLHRVPPWIRVPSTIGTRVSPVVPAAIYHMLRDGTFYQDLGADDFQKDTPYAQAKKLAQRIATLGFNCAIAPKAETAVVSV